MKRRLCLGYSPHLLALLVAVIWLGGFLVQSTVVQLYSKHCWLIVTVRLLLAGSWQPKLLDDHVPTRCTPLIPVLWHRYVSCTLDGLWNVRGNVLNFFEVTWLNLWDSLGPYLLLGLRLTLPWGMLITYNLTIVICWRDINAPLRWIYSLNLESPGLATALWCFAKERS